MRGEEHLAGVMSTLCEALKIAEPRYAESYLNNWLAQLEINIDETWEGTVEVNDRKELAQGKSGTYDENPIIFYQQIEWIFRQKSDW